MKVRLLFLTAIIALCGCNSNGQQKTKLQTKNSVAQSNSFETVASELIQKVEEKTYQGIAPNGLAPDVVTIDADNIKAIINGACIIEKGDLEAMIDLKGKFIIPWGKYSYQVSELNFPFTALISVSNPKTHLAGFINTKGQVVVPISYNGADPYNCNKMASVSMNGGTHKLLDINGNAVNDPFFRTTNSYLTSFGRALYNQKNLDDRIAFTKRTVVMQKNGRMPMGYAYPVGFANHKGQIIIPNTYPDAGDFSDGLASVANQDQFGTVKWGYIDATGKLVIPYTYQVQPGNFHSGLALVKPVEKTDFDFAYIDKQGNIKFKLGDGKGHMPYLPSGVKEYIEITTNPFGNMEGLSLYETAGYFIKNYAVWSNGYDAVLLDTTGKFHKLGEIVKDSGLKSDKTGLFIKGYDDLGIYFYKRDKSHLFGNDYGMVDYDGNNLFPAYFTSLKPDYYSSYAYATAKTGPNSGVAGIINRQGVFVLIIGEKSKF